MSLVGIKALVDVLKTKSVKTDNWITILGKEFRVGENEWRDARDKIDANEIHSQKLRDLVDVVIMDTRSNADIIRFLKGFDF